jgi:hypothetical protein
VCRVRAIVAYADNLGGAIVSSGTIRESSRVLHRFLAALRSDAQFMGTLRLIRAVP